MTVKLYNTVSGAEIRTFVGQTGQIFQAEIGRTAFDLTGATRKQFKFQRPAGTVKTVTATEVSPPDGESRVIVDELGNATTLLVQLEYTVTDPNLFDVSGTWRRWVEVESPTYKHFGAVTEFVVFDVGAA